MIRRLCLAAVLIALAACGGGGGGTDLATIGPAEFGGGGDEVEVTHLSDPIEDRRTVFGVVENGTGETKADVVVAGVAFDSAGTQVAQSRAQVIAPLTLAKGGLGLVRITFDNPLPDPFTIEWEIRKGDREKDAVDVKVTSLDVDASGAVRVTVENSTGGRVLVTFVAVLCLDDAGKSSALHLIDGPDNRVAKSATVQVEGNVGAGCTSAVAGAIGTKNVT